MKSEVHRHEKVESFLLEVDGIMAIDFLEWLLSILRFRNGHFELSLSKMCRLRRLYVSCSAIYISVLRSSWIYYEIAGFSLCSLERVLTTDKRTEFL